MRNRSGRVRCLPTTLAVADQVYRTADPAQHMDNVYNVGWPGVRAGPIGVAMSASIDRHDSKALGQQRAKRRKAACMVPHAVTEHDRHRARVAPLDVVDPHARRFDETTALRFDHA